MYFLNYGNASLLPERSIMASVGTLWQPVSWIGLDAALFASTIEDLIVSVPTSPVVTSASNVGRASSIGAEVSVKASALDNRLTGAWNYTVQDVRDQTGRPGLDDTPIVYVPVEMIHMHFLWNDGMVIGRVEWSYTSHRYAQAGGEITSLLERYQIFNAALGVMFTGNVLSGGVQLRMDNVFDERYAIVRGYPMPGRMLRLMLETKW
jgi:outer membrane cobalamin receptor